MCEVVDAIVLVSGKRFSGKDHLVSVARSFFGQGRSGPIQSEFASTTDLFKEDFTEKYKDEIDHDRLMLDREYKEQHRMMMTAYWEDIKAVDRTRYCSRLLAQAYQMFRDDNTAKLVQGKDSGGSEGFKKQVNLFFVTGIRYSWEIEYFEQKLQENATQTLAPIEFKKQLGCPIDTHETETELDSFNRWDLVFTNDALGNDCTIRFLRDDLVDFVQHRPE